MSASLRPEVGVDKSTNQHPVSFSALLSSINFLLAGLFLTTNQQCQSTEGKTFDNKSNEKYETRQHPIIV